MIDWSGFIGSMLIGWLLASAGVTVSNWQFWAILSVYAIVCIIKEASV
jgi:hypothetical protein